MCEWVCVQQQQHTFQPVYALFHLSLANSFRIQFTVKRHTTDIFFVSQSSLVEVVSKNVRMHVLVYDLLFVILRRNVLICVNFVQKKRQKGNGSEKAREKERKKCVCWRKNLPLSIIPFALQCWKFHWEMYMFYVCQIGVTIFYSFFFSHSFCFVLFSVFSFSHRIEITLNCILSPWLLSLSTQCYLNVHL